MLLYAFVCVLVSVVQAQNQVAPSVNTTQGVVIGNVAADGNYFTFYGLRYGGSTAGANRFKAPTPPPNYPGDFHAMDSSIICAQPSQRGLIGVEDCLTLNIFTSNVTTPKPVLVWLQGEEYTSTDNRMYSFKRFVEEGVVVVSLNYRLSIFGFLCLGVAEAPGNAGLKDVVQGLKWIKDNIAGFGGNPNNVALFGHGSAAAMVDLITMSPLAENLIHKAIVQSGSALSPWAIAYNPVGYADMFGAKLGYDGKSRTELAQHLVATDLSVLAPALEDFKFTNNTPLFAPCIEDVNLNPNDTFLADAPINLLRSGNYSHIPYIAGYVSREGTLRAQEAAFGQWLEKMQVNFTDFLPVDLKFDNEVNKTSVAQDIRNYYFSQRAVNMETIEDYLDYQGDTMVLVSVVRGARLRAATSQAEVRLYEFAYRGTRNSDWVFTQIPLTGVKHGGVLNFLLNNDLLPADEPVMTSLIRRYVNFANTGVPSFNATNDWLPVSNATFNYLFYGGESTASSFTEPRANPHQQRMTFWNDLYDKYYVAPKAVSSATSVISFVALLVLSQVIINL